MRPSETGQGRRWPLAGARVAGQGLASAQTPSEAAPSGKELALAGAGGA